MKVTRVLLLLLALVVAPCASGQGERLGIVVMHGKGGRPGAPHMTEFVDRLEGRGFLVTNLEMPW